MVPLYPLRRRLPVLLLGVVLLAGSSVVAHVQLQIPNGGESIETGFEYTIQWRVLVQHETRNWDLYYSASGTSALG